MAIDLYKKLNYDSSLQQRHQQQQQKQQQQQQQQQRQQHEDPDNERVNHCEHDLSNPQSCSQCLLASSSDKGGGGGGEGGVADSFVRPSRAIVRPFESNGNNGKKGDNHQNNGSNDNDNGNGGVLSQTSRIKALPNRFMAPPLPPRAIALRRKLIRFAFGSASCVLGWLAVLVIGTLLNDDSVLLQCLSYCNQLIHSLPYHQHKLMSHCLFLLVALVFFRLVEGIWCILMVTTFIFLSL
jgi:hypothetical protein